MSQRMAKRAHVGADGHSLIEIPSTVQGKPGNSGHDWYLYASGQGMLSYRDWIRKSQETAKAV